VVSSRGIVTVRGVRGRVEVAEDRVAGGVMINNHPWETAQAAGGVRPAWGDAYGVPDPRL